jgi:hypothetical protein
MEFLSLWLVFCVPSALVALSKKRSPLVWGIAGLILGPIGFLTIGFMEKKEDERARRKCLFCAEFIPVEATVCRYCRSEIKPIAPFASSLTENISAGLQGYQMSETKISEDGIVEVSPAKKATNAQKTIAVCGLLFLAGVAAVIVFANFFAK